MAASYPIIDPGSRLFEMLDRAEPRMRRAVLNALAAADAANGDLDALVALIEAGRVDEAVQAAARAGAVRIADEHAAVYTMAGREGAEFLTDALEVTIGFDQVNERAVRTLRQERFRLIQEFTAEQRRATREALVQGTIRGLNPRDQAREFRRSIGLTLRQQQAVQNYRSLLERGSSEALTRQLRDRRFDATVRRAAREGRQLSQDQVDRMVGRYRDRYVRYRSEVIARTEALRAVHQGTDETYHQGVEQGAFERDQLRREWVTARDERVRDSHDLLDGEVRGLDEPFEGLEGQLMFPGDPLAPASETAQCRCALATRVEAPDRTPTEAG